MARLITISQLVLEGTESHTPHCFWRKWNSGQLPFNKPVRCSWEKSQTVTPWHAYKLQTRANFLSSEQGPNKTEALSVQLCNYNTKPNYEITQVWPLSGAIMSIRLKEYSVRKSTPLYHLIQPLSKELQLYGISLKDPFQTNEPLILSRCKDSNSVS